MFEDKAEAQIELSTADEVISAIIEVASEVKTDQSASQAVQKAHPRAQTGLKNARYGC